MMKMRKLQTDTFEEKRNEINELNNLVKAYSERIEDDIVHLKLTGPAITRHDAERAIAALRRENKISASKERPSCRSRFRKWRLAGFPEKG